MPIIKDMLDKFRGKDQHYSELERNFRNEKKLADRQLSSNERELRGYKEKAHEQAVKKELEGFRARQQKDWVHGNQKFLHDSNTFTKGENALVGANVHRSAKL